MADNLTYYLDDGGLDVLAVFGEDITAILDRQTGHWRQSPVGLDVAMGEDSSMHPITEQEAAVICAKYGGMLPQKIPTPVPRE